MDNTNNKTSASFNSKPTWITLWVLALVSLVVSLQSLALIRPKTCIALCIAALIFSLAGTLAGISAKKAKLEITDKFVYLKTLFIKEMYLPLDSVTGIKTGLLGSVCISAPSFKIRCVFVKNKAEIAEAVKEAIKNR